MSNNTKLDWIRNDPSCASVCDKIRLSLSIATRCCDEDSDAESLCAAPTATAPPGPKIPLQCGHAKYQDKKRVWNIRHRAVVDPSASVPATARIDKSERLTTLTLQNGHEKDLVQHPAQLICRLKEKGKKKHFRNFDADGEDGQNTTSNLTAPPSVLIQSILRGTELASMFQQARKDMVSSGGAFTRCWSFDCRQPINLDPVLKLILQKSGSFESRDPNTRDALLDRASQYSMKLTADYVEKWKDYTAFWDGDTLIDFDEDENEAFDAIYSFVEDCLDERVLELHTRISTSSPTQSTTSTSAARHSVDSEPAPTSATRRKRSHSEPTEDGGESSKRRRRTSSEGDDHGALSTPQDRSKDILTQPDLPSRTLPRGARTGKKAAKRTPARAAKSIKENLNPVRKNPTRSSRPLVLLEPGQLSAREIEKGISAESLGNFNMKTIKIQHPRGGSDNNCGGTTNRIEKRATGRLEEANGRRGALPTNPPELKKDRTVDNENTRIPASFEHQGRRRRNRSESVDSAQSRLRRSPRKRFRWDDTEQMHSPFGYHNKIDRQLSQGSRSNLSLLKSELAVKRFLDTDSVLSMSNVDLNARVDEKIISSTDYGDLKNQDSSVRTELTQMHSHENDQHSKDSAKKLNEGGITTRIKPSMAHPMSPEISTDASDAADPENNIPNERLEKPISESLIDTEEMALNGSGMLAANHDDWDEGASWVKLSHIGHISDYHGFQRRHDTFFPLKYNKSVSETRDAIEATLAQAEAEKVEVNDQEIDDELESLDNIFSTWYPEKAREERARKLVRGQSQKGRQQGYEDVQHKSLREAQETFGSRPILFSSTITEQLDDCALGDECNICRVICTTEGDDNSGQAKCCTNFEFIETEDTLEFWKDESGKHRKRPSRTSELTAYRRISVMMLREMRNTLNFIEEYNGGLNGDAKSASASVEMAGSEIPNNEFEKVDKRFEDGEEAMAAAPQTSEGKLLSAGSTMFHDGDDVAACATSQSQKDFTVDGDEAIEKAPRKRDHKHYPSRRTRTSIPKPGQEAIGHPDIQHSSQYSHLGRTRAQCGAHRGKRTEQSHHHPRWTKLSHVGLLSDYQGLCRQHKSFYALPTHGSIESLKGAISKIIDDDRVGGDDDDILAETRAYVRIVRGYNGKADQERIEKNEHEEQRLLKVREFEYWNKSKKVSPEEEEYSRLETRPLRFVQHGGVNNKCRKDCRFGVTCVLCKSTSIANLKIDMNDKDTTSILNPGFHKKGIDDVDDAEEIENPNARRSRTAELSKQRRLSVLHLKEMYSTLDFIEKYNTGWINTTGNKRRKT